MKSVVKSLILPLLASAVTSVSAGGLRVRQTAVTVTKTVTSASAESTAYNWAAGATPEYPIHASCNATERAQLRRGLNEAVLVAEHARDHIRRFGNSSEFYVKWFGKAASAEAIGWYDRIASADKKDTWFRCDNIDGNCQLPGWGGHWRGNNATQETVICPLSYSTRKPLDALCGFGYTIATGTLNFYFASDLIHRMLHLPRISEGAVDHFADGYADCIELAKTNPAEAARNSHTLQYFALDVYAYDIALPGVGCSGKPPAVSSAASAVASATSAAASATGGASQDCHTHADGEIHCV